MTVPGHSPDTLQAAGRRSLVDTTIDQLREQLAAGAWPVGSRIPTEHELAERLRVGRNTVREAIRVLVHAGMLVSRQGEGTFVRSTSDPASVLRGVQRSGVRDVLEVRAALEAEGPGSPPCGTPPRTSSGCGPRWPARPR